jgi:hypothetical protein
VVVGRELSKNRANVSATARELNVPSHDLRRLTRSAPRLTDAALEEAHRLIDAADANIWRELHGDNEHRRLAASMYVIVQLTALIRPP